MLFLSIECITWNLWEVPAMAEEATEPLGLYAQSAVLMDATSGRILYGKEENVSRPMASTTKIMTCILTLENVDLSEIATVSAYAASMPQVKLGMKTGEQYVVEDLLYSLMLESHNDVAVVLAEHVAGSVEKFAKMMNQKAKEIGCIDTYFITPNGLDAQTEERGMEKNHGTTAVDLARIMRYCIMQSDKKAAFLQITRTPDWNFQDVAGKRNFSCQNHNAFLQQMEGALTGKTGFTTKAGYCYVGALQRDNRVFIVSLLACGWPNHKSYKWEDTRKLMEYGLANYQYHVFEEPLHLEDVLVTNAKTEKGNPYQGKRISCQKEEKCYPIGMLLGEGERIVAKVAYQKTVEAPVQKGQYLGMVQYFLKGEGKRDLLLGEEEIRAAEGAMPIDYLYIITYVVKRYIAQIL